MANPQRRAKRAGHDLRTWKASLTRLRSVVLGLTMRDFAHKLGVHWTTVRSWEEWGTFPTERLLDRLYDFAAHEAGWGVDNWRADHKENGTNNIDTWMRKVEAWATLVRMRANLPDHPLHMTMYLPLYQWLVDNQPDIIGFPPKESSTHE